MTDGPSSPEQPVTPSSPKSGGLGRLFRREGQAPAQQEQIETEQPAQPENKFTSLMAELDKRNQEFGGNFLSEFGEGDSRFQTIRHPLEAEETKYPTDNSTHNNRVNDDYLIVTAEGFRILRVRKANLEHDPQYPQFEVVHKRDDSINFAGTLARALMWRGDPNKRWADPEEKAGGGYSHDPAAFKGLNHNLNFGQEHSLAFLANSKNDQLAYLQRLTPIVKKFAESRNTVTSLRNRTDVLVGNIESHGLISLVIQPNQEEVAEIMRESLKEAKDAQARERQRLQEEEEKKLAPSESITPETEPDNYAGIAAKQEQTADEVLKILEES